MKRKIVAITGGIGSGKSTVVHILRQKGYKTVDCDILAKQIAELPQTVDKVCKLLGKDAVSDGKLNRPYIRKTVFANSDLLAEYNKIFFDGVKRLLADEAERNETLFAEIAVIDAFDFPWDEIWLVRAAEQSRVERVRNRDGVDEQNVRNVMSRQHYDGTYSVVITNDGNENDLAETVQKQLERLGL